MKDVLVTGGSGFLGRPIVDELVAAGNNVRTLQRGPSQAGPAAARSGDVRDAAAVAAAMDGVEVVIHAAGLAHVFDGAATAPFEDINARGAAVVAGAAVTAGVRHFVHVSSVAVYGAGSDGREDAICRPNGPYAASKASAETRVIAAAANSAMRVTILRLATLYGEGDRGNVQRLLRLIADGRFIWLGSGSNRKSLIHVRDAARACAIVAAADDRGEPVETYNVSAPAVSMRDVVDELARAVASPVPRWHVPDAAARALAAAAGWVLPSRAQSITKWLGDDVYPGERFARRFRFETRMLLREGIERQVAEWRASGGVVS